MSESTARASQFRPDIEGLRGVAVLLVVLFHAGVPFLPGGFIGVDVFFVISGYLITGLLVEEAQRSGTVSIPDFYARRARRLLPGLLLMLAACLIAGHFLLPESAERQGLAMSVLATLGFVSNFFFWRVQSGYFADAAETLPLLHTWTLAVEEQFYILWPLAIAVGFWLARRIRISARALVTVGIVALGLVSFGFSLWLTATRPSAAFYLPPGRVWEFAAGAALALGLPRTIATRLSWMPIAELGLGLILAGAITLDGSSAWPGLAALLPIGAAVMVIAGGKLAPNRPGSRLLSCRPLRAVGAISYSWYLWHWPALVCLNVAMLGEAGPVERVGAVIVSLAVAVASHHFLEAPIRERRIAVFASTYRAIGAAVVGICAFAVVAAGELHKAESDLRASPLFAAIEVARADHGVLPPECQHSRNLFSGLTDPVRCRLGRTDARKAIVIWGDSHAEHLLGLLDKIGRHDDFAVIARTRPACRPLGGELGPVGIVVRTPAIIADCARFNAAVAEELPMLAQQGAAVVVLASRWPPNGEAKHREATVWEQQLRADVEVATRAGLDVVLAAPSPEMAQNVPVCLSRRDPGACSWPAIDNARNATAAMAVLRSVAMDYPRTRIWEPSAGLCGETCRILTDSGSLIFRDTNHFTLSGALYLASHDDFNFFPEGNLQLSQGRN